MAPTIAMSRISEAISKGKTIFGIQHPPQYLDIGLTLDRFYGVRTDGALNKIHGRKENKQENGYSHGKADGPFLDKGLVSGLPPEVQHRDNKKEEHSE